MSESPKPNFDLEIIASDEGFVVHDSERGVVHYLNQTAAIVLSLCDGVRTVEEIARILQRQFDLEAPPVDDVTDSIRTLSDQGLLA